jgi:hypothetical protein
MPTARSHSEKVATVFFDEQSPQKQGHKRLTEIYVQKSRIRPENVIFIPPKHGEKRSNLKSSVVTMAFGVWSNRWFA